MARFELWDKVARNLTKSVVPAALVSRRSSASGRDRQFHWFAIKLVNTGAYCNERNAEEKAVQVSVLLTYLLPYTLLLRKSVTYYTSLIAEVNATVARINT